MEPKTDAVSGRVLVLKQACYRVDTGNWVTLTAGSLNIVLAARNANMGAGCQSFEPGFVVPPGVDVACAASGTANFICAVSGVVAKEQ